MALTARRRITATPLTNALVIGLAAAAIGLTAGCAFIAPSGDHYVAPPLGTSWVTSRVDSGSFGTSRGKTETKRGEQEWKGEHVISYEAAGLTQLLRADGGIVAFKNGDRPIVSFDPPLGMAYPLQVGKTTTSTHQVTLYPLLKVIELRVTQTVEAAEEVTVPAGTFKTFRVRWSEGGGTENIYWQCPDVGFSVKTIMTRTATHSAGAGRRESQLLSLTRK